jgi:hypothetical protein
MFLTQLFGIDNNPLSKVLVDHAKGNGFLAEVGKTYHMNKWVHQSPAHEKDKLWADMVEVWLGAVELERRVWREPDSGSEMELFLEELWTIRYQKLHETWLTGRMDLEYPPKDTVPIRIKILDIEMPRSTELMQLCGFTGSMSNRPIGHLAEASVEVNKEDSTFHTVMAKRLSNSEQVARTLATDKLLRLLRG